MDRNNLTGNTYGRWKVQGDYILAENGRRKWLCQCDCGTERYVLESSLKQGISQSCGCSKSGKKGYDLIGRVFGKLTVTGESENQGSYGGIWWHCVCRCGTEKDYPATLLVTGKRTSCGCDKKKGNRLKDISGQKVGDITALYPTDKRDKKGNVIWHCRCDDCGNEFDLSYNELMYTDRKSCGCKRRQHYEKLHSNLTHIAGTSIDIRRSNKLPANNTTGHKGVYYIKGKYTAKIVFQKKAYYLGNYTTYEEAVEARQAAERLLLKGTVDHYEKWMAKASENPQWAKENPISIKVWRNGNSEIEADFLPAI